MNKGLLVVIVVVAGLFYWWQSSSVVGKTEWHDQVIMYSVSGNPVCKIKAEELRRENIKFTEFFVDQDRSKLEDVQYKLVKADFDRLSGRYEFPIFDVHGVILIDNPSVSKIKKYVSR